MDLTWLWPSNPSDTWLAKALVQGDHSWLGAGGLLRRFPAAVFVGSCRISPLALRGRRYAFGLARRGCKGRGVCLECDRHQSELGLSVLESAKSKRRMALWTAMSQRFMGAQLPWSPAVELHVSWLLDGLAMQFCVYVVDHLKAARCS